MVEDKGKVLGWDDEINNESSFELLPEGDYDFKVTKFERARFDGSDKLPACNKANVTFELTSKDGSGIVTEGFLLCEKMEWKLSQFFIAIGQKKHGEPLRMNWNNVLGATGKCKVVVDTYKKNDGTEGKVNRINKYYEPTETKAAGGWTPGAF